MWNNGWSNQNVSEDAAFLGFFIKIGVVILGTYMIWIKFIKPCFEWVQVVIYQPFVEWIQSIVIWMQSLF